MTRNIPILKAQVVANMPNTDLTTNTVGWRDINWRKVERYIFKLQKRIYVASRRGDVKQVRKLQKTLMRSWSNKVLAVRRVTQDNRGSAT
ncbi:MAG: reverse transcriptase N-terminal domain-containing protein [Xenococcaceae cyanobacterium MO_188.B32]|nr:reverse transcriptase N-terminal domain-containing protein [Xenococcaceae cyanobacterium MO_188.B32]